MKYERVQESKKSPPSTRSTSRTPMRVRDNDSGRCILASSSSESEVGGVRISSLFDNVVGRNRSPESAIFRAVWYDLKCCKGVRHLCSSPKA